VGVSQEGDASLADHDRKSKAGGRLCAHPAETVATVYRSVAARAERYHGVVAALGAYDRVHFPRSVLIHAAAATTASLFTSANGPATPAPLGFISEPASLEEFLFPGGENELGAAFHTYHGFVRQCHW
jgi:hypothetical protein